MVCICVNSNWRKRNVKIAVCIKQVPGTTAVEVDPATGTLKRDGVESKLNPCDLYAIETALRLKEKYKASVTAVTMGPPQAAAVLRESFMMGVDEGVLVSDRKFAGADVLSTARTLSQALTVCGPFDLVICGRQTTDGDTSQVGSETAELLKVPHVCNVTKIFSVDDRSISAAAVMPRCLMKFRMELPALITVDESIAEPRLPSYKLKLATADRKIRVLTLADLPDREESHYGQSGSPTRVIRVFPPEHDVKKERWEGSGQETAARLFDLLDAGKYLQNPR